MTAIFNQVEFIHRLESEGLARGAAETIATGIDEGRRDLVTKIELEKSLSRQTIQFGAMLAAGLALAVSILGTIIALH